MRINNNTHPVRFRVGAAVLCRPRQAGWRKKPQEEKYHGSSFNETVARSRCSLRTPDQKMEP